MTISSLTIKLVLAGTLLMGTVIAGSMALSHGLDAENRLTGRRLERAFNSILLKAHQAKDDLVLQETVAAMAQAPGVSFACIVDSEEKALAHSRPAYLGKTFQVRKSSGELFSFPLKDGRTTWGTLIFSLSDKMTRGLWWKSVAAMTGVAVLLLLFFAWMLLRHVAEVSAFQQTVQDHKTLIEEAKSETAQWKERCEETRQKTLHWLQTVIDRTPQSAVLLDAQQRVIAMTSLARAHLQIPPEKSLTDLSWQDVPWLQDQGAALEQSLQNPGRAFRLGSGAIQTDQHVTWVDVPQQNAPTHRQLEAV